MPRKEQSADQVRAKIKKKYVRGSKAVKVMRGVDALTATEKIVKMELACYLKAQDYPWSYISDSLGVSESTLKNWWQKDDLGMVKRVEEIHADMVGGAIKLLKSYAIEIIEELMGLFRTTEDEAVAMKIGFELLDRLGLAKVNKSESVVATTAREEVALTDPDGLLDRMRDMSPEAQAEAAAKLEEIFAMVPEGGSA